MSREYYIRQFAVGSGMRFSGCQFFKGERPWNDKGKCGRETIAGSVYCKEHDRRCHQKLPDKMLNFLDRPKAQWKAWA